MFRGPDHTLTTSVTVFEQWEQTHDGWHLVNISGDKKTFTVLKGDKIIERKWEPVKDSPMREVQW